jgi:Bacterial archaeo-eukaryotic release factor family 10
MAVWIDHASARLFELRNGEPPRVSTMNSGAESQHRSTGQSGVPPPGHIGGNSESHYQNRREGQLHRFYDEVIERLLNCDALLILGPGEAKHELIGRMERRPGLQPRDMKTETVSRLSDPQIAEKLRQFAASTAAGTAGA